MATRHWKTGPAKSTLYSRAYRITLRLNDADLLPFFQQLEQLPSDRRNEALLAAIRGGAQSAQAEIQNVGRESKRISSALDNLLSEFD